MAKMDFEPENHTFLEVVTFHEKIEMIEATENLHLTKPKRKYEDKGEQDSTKKASFKKGKKDDDDGPPCLLCKILGGNANSHSTSRCNKKKLFNSNNNKTDFKKKKYVWKKNEHTAKMNAVVKKTVASKMKKHFKKAGLDYEDTSSS